MASVRHPVVSGRQINADDYDDEHIVELDAADVTGALGYTPANAVDVAAALSLKQDASTAATNAELVAGLAGKSDVGHTHVQAVTLLVTDPAGAALTTGDGKMYWPVPSTINGWNLTSVSAFLTTASSSGLPTFQIANTTQAVDMLTTKVSIDATELTSATATTAAAIDPANDDVATGDMLRVDCDVAGTGAKGVIIELQFTKP